MTPLPLTFKRWNYTFTQVVREGDLAIYCQQHNDADVRRYEVIRIREEAAHALPNGRMLEAREAYPGSSSWGTLGFTFYTLADAEAKMQSLQTDKESTL